MINRTAASNNISRSCSHTQKRIYKKSYSEWNHCNLPSVKGDNNNFNVDGRSNLFFVLMEVDTSTTAQSINKVRNMFLR